MKQPVCDETGEQCMLKLKCNIDQSDRTNRMVFGVILVVGALIGLGKLFMILLGSILFIEGAIGWCGIPIIIAKIRQLFSKK